MSRLSQNILSTPGNVIPVETSAQQIERLIRNVSQVFIGKESLVAKAVMAMVCGGHLLLEDVPGLGKTLLAKALAKSIHADFKRIQFTADLLPSDITGINIYSPENHQFSFRKGPIFTNIVLGDEINRATPRTQSSLLEAMEEHGVTVDGELHPLAWPFFVIATQNPVELEGTYPLPFAQMDRFMMRLSIGYLSREAEVNMLKLRQKSDPLESLQPVMEISELRKLHELVQAITITDPVLGYIVDIIGATRKDPALEFGASPRGSLDVQLFSQALALWHGRDYVLPDDVKEASRTVLPHRLIIKKGNRSVTLNSKTILDQIIDQVPVPV